MPNVQVTTTTITSPKIQRPSAAKKILVGFVKLVLYMAFVLLAVYYTPKILSNVLHTPYPLATITSGSMWPALKVNDLILMKGISGQEAKIGQIIVYENKEQGFTIHRLVREENGKLVTKGDANNVEDAPVSKSDVIGRAVYIGQHPVRVPWLGTIAKNLGPRLNKK